MRDPAGLKELENELQESLDHASHCCDLMVGRDTYPLIDDSASPFDIYFCTELERIRGALSHLKDQTGFYREWCQDTLDRSGF